ncbi:MULTISPECIES: hypothetical protein [Halostella]|uniref:hypothetical protein n=1 Tax=Halostella TaxID=1843185 RepID=UPI0010817D96|nr:MULTISPECIES: hypothetical protein [Halostella]
MTEGTDADVADAQTAAERRDEVVARVTDHAGQIARELALLRGDDYGTETFSTDAGEWAIKYEAGVLQYLRFSGRSGGETYVVSTQQPPDPDELAEAMEDYDAFVAAWNEYVRSLEGTLDDVSASFPAVESTQEVAAERDRIVAQVREVANAMAGELHRYEGSDYGEFTARVDGKRWKLKRDGSETSYLRVGGDGGIYILSQYGPPSPADLRANLDGVVGFVEAFNEHVDDVDADLSSVSL